MLLDPETLGSRPARRLGARRGRRGRVPGADQPRADAVGDRDHDARLRERGRGRAAAAPPPALRRRDRPPARAAASPRPAPTRSACSSASGSRPRTATGVLVDQLQYIARRELIFGMHIHAAVDDPEKAIQVVERTDRAPAGAPGALGQLAVLARRADRALLVAADGLLGVPPLGRAAALRELRGLRRGRRAARADRLHRRLHAHLVGHPAAPAARHGRAANLRRGDAARGRRRARRLLPVAREAALRARRVGRDGTELPPDPHDREQVARRPARPAARR